MRNEKNITYIRGGKVYPTYIKRKKGNWIGHILPRNCLLKHVFEEEMQGTGRGGRRRKRLFNGLKEKEYTRI